MPTTTRSRGFEPRCRPSCSSLNPTDARGTHMDTLRSTSSQHDPDAVPVSLGDLVASIRGRIVTPGDPGWDAARQAWNLAVDQRPALVAMPLDPDDVRAIVQYAARPRVADRTAGNRPRRRGARLTRRHDPAVDATHARRRNRRDQADRSCPGGNALARGHRGNVPVRAVSPLGLLARRRRRRVHARRRPELVGAPARPRLQPCDGDRGRHRRRRASRGQRRRRTRSCSGRCAVAEATSAW